jgi:hypothetical protein
MKSQYRRAIHGVKERHMADHDDDELTAEDIEMLAKRKARHEARLAVLATLERRIGLPEGFFWSIRNEQNDWAFIVKLGVICEAALTHALVMAVGNDQLFEHFSELQQGRRLAVAKQLGIISDEDRHTLGAIAYVRNSFAHRVENLTGSLRAFYEGLNQDQKIDLMWKLVQMDKKPKKDEDMSGHAQFFKLQLFACSIRPIQSIANFGLDVDKNAEEEKLKHMTLSDMFGTAAEMYREKIVK